MRWTQSRLVILTWKRMMDTQAGSNIEKGGKQMSVERMCHTGSGLIISPPSYWANVACGQRAQGEATRRRKSINRWWSEKKTWSSDTRELEGPAVITWYILMTTYQLMSVADMISLGWCVWSVLKYGARYVRSERKSAESCVTAAWLMHIHHKQMLFSTLNYVCRH